MKSLLELTKECFICKGNKNSIQKHQSFQILNKNFKIKDPVFNFNKDLIDNKTQNIEKAQSIIQICKCKRFLHQNCFFIYLIYTGNLKCEKCGEFSDIKTESSLSLKQKAFMMDNNLILLFYFFFLILLIIISIILFQSKISDEYIHVKPIFGLFFLFIGIFIIIFFVKKILYLIKINVPDNLSFDNKNNEKNPLNDSDYIKIGNISNSYHNLLENNENKNNNYFNYLNNNGNNYSVLRNSNNNEIPNSVNKKSLTLVNNYLMNGQEQKDFTLMNPSKLNINSNFNINNDIKENEIYIKKSVLKSFTYFSDFNCYRFNRNIFEIFELKYNFILKSNIISQKNFIDKSTFDELKIWEKEVLMEEENRLAIENLNKNIFNIDLKRLNNIEKNNSYSIEKKNFNMRNSKNGQENDLLLKNFNPNTNGKNDSKTINTSSIINIKKKSISENLKQEFQPILENDEEDDKNRINGKKQGTQLKDSIKIKIISKYYENISKNNTFDSNTGNLNNLNNSNSINVSDKNSANGEKERKLFPPLSKFSSNSNPRYKRFSSHDSTAQEKKEKKQKLIDENEGLNYQEYFINEDLDYIKTPKNQLFDDKNNLINNFKNGNFFVDSKNNLIKSNNNGNKINLINIKKEKNSIINKNNINGISNNNNLLFIDKTVATKSTRKNSKKYDLSLETLLLKENNKLNQDSLKMPKNIFEAETVKPKLSQNFSNLNELKKITKQKKENTKMKQSFFSQDNNDIILNLKNKKINSESKMFSSLGTQISSEKKNNLFGTDLNVNEELRKHNIDLTLFNKNTQIKKHLKDNSNKKISETDIRKSLDIPLEIEKKIQSALRNNNVKNTVEFIKTRKLELDEKDEFSLEEKSSLQNSIEDNFDYDNISVIEEQKSKGLKSGNFKDNKEEKEENKEININQLNAKSSMALKSSEEDSSFCSGFSSSYESH